MMKFIFTYSILWLSTTLFAQPNTEVYLLDISGTTTLQVNNFKNISNNNGYDNQPFFANDSTLVYARTRNNQTDVFAYVTNGYTAWLTNTRQGSEYSPQYNSDSKELTAVRLDTNGLQRLYRYKFEEKPKSISNQEVAYYTFYNELLIATVLGNNSLDLIVYNEKEDKVYKILKGAGRAIHTIRNTNSVSYTAINEEGNSDIYQLDLDTLESFFVAQLPIGIQDHIWLNETTLLCGSGASLFYYDLFGQGEWKKAVDLSDKKIKDITRLAISPNKKKLALVAEFDGKTPSEIVQAHIKPFNNRDLEGFVKAFSENVAVTRFPADTLYTGKEALRNDYIAYYKNNNSATVKVTNRIEIGNFVIDEEFVTQNGKEHTQVTIYTTGNQLITSMNFVSTKKGTNVEAIIDQQLDAYNSRDIDAFMNTYTENIQLYNYPNYLTSSGQAPMRQSFQSFFKNTPDLHCEIKNRIVYGNKVIDQEYITANGQNFSAVAIYEVADGKISKVTFVR